MTHQNSDIDTTQEVCRFVRSMLGGIFSRVCRYHLQETDVNTSTEAKLKGRKDTISVVLQL